MAGKTTEKTFIQKLGAIFFGASILVFLILPFVSSYQLETRAVRSAFENEDHISFVEQEISSLIDRSYNNPFSFVSAYRNGVKNAQEKIVEDVESRLGLTKNDGDYYNKILQNYQIKQSFLSVTKASSQLSHKKLWFFLIYALSVIGALMYILPKFRHIPGIRNNHIYHRSMHNRGWLGMATAVFLISFYILIYFYPEYGVNWIILLDPISLPLSGNPAGQWFFYGFLYTLCVLVMGIRMYAKYRHNMYQMVRTTSVIFFQLGFAFLIPEILISLNKPYYDFKNIFPLDYDFFFEYNLNSLLSSGNLGLFMLVWGIVLTLIAVPILTYIYGKRWYCSWVCGCGGLAETLGDPYRQLSDKRLSAWKFERWIVHGVLVFSIAMTALVLYTYFTGSSRILFLDSFTIRGIYGFAIGSIFAGVVGTGFYPVFGNRVWCRFGCPLAAYIGIVQRFKSRFRITTNGGQCISCGNCSTYCEMGIDVRHYAQRGQDIVRASCVGCGVCAAVCPRGVLRLENSSVDVDNRAEELRVIRISREKVELAG